jgi:hypothetical protein
MCKKTGRPCAKRALGICPVELTSEVTKETNEKVEEFVPLQTIRFALGKIIFCALNGRINFGTINSTTNPGEVREFAKILEDVATMMENCGGHDEAD